jgi:hypothetical protein
VVYRLVDHDPAYPSFQRTTLPVGGYLLEDLDKSLLKYILSLHPVPAIAHTQSEHWRGKMLIKHVLRLPLLFYAPLNNSRIQWHLTSLQFVRQWFSD